MKIGIATNYSYPLQGGCETVTKQIAEGLKEHEFIIYSTNVKSDFTNNNIKYKNCGKNYLEFINKTKEDKIEHLLIYSDYFKFWPLILGMSEFLPYKKSICLVGMNQMIQDKNLFNLFIKKKDQFSVIEHSNLLDCYKICLDNNININIIPNGIDFNEFNKINKNNFIKKYNLDNNKIVLIVSNFFYGKGQEIMPKVVENIGLKNINYIFISSSVEFQLADRLESKVMSEMTRICNLTNNKCYFYKNMPRNDLIEAFAAADVFAFPSLKESFGVVPIESNAVGVPFVSFDVGEMPNLNGGIKINCKNDINNYKIPNIKEFSDNIKLLLESEELNNKLGLDGLYQVQNDYNLQDILKKYNKIFRGYY